MNNEEKNIELEKYLDEKELLDENSQIYQEKEIEKENNTDEKENTELIKKFKSLSFEEIEIEIKNALEEVRPFLLQHDGDLEYIGYKNGIVSIRLTGACVGCPQSIYTLKLGIENFLKERIPIVDEVDAIE